MTSLQIALCDDNSLSLQLAQLAIQEYERQHPDRLCRLHCFSSGTALLSFLDKHKDFCFDLFILDVVMPEPDGIQIGSSVRMVSFDELISAELNSRTILYTLADGSVLQTPTIRSSFKTEVATLLAHEQFVQCSVSSVVNLRYVRCLEKNCLYLLDGRQISISRQAGAGVRSKWQKYWSSPSETHVEF